jgi:hypothetical protein
MSEAPDFKELYKESVVENAGLKGTLEYLQTVVGTLLYNFGSDIEPNIRRVRLGEQQINVPAGRISVQLEDGEYNFDFAIQGS